jgi:MFS family permease
VSQLAFAGFRPWNAGDHVGHPLLLLAAALVIGTGYGVINPTASSLLNQHAPAHRRGLFFSIKQSGVPLGVALSGLLMPWGLATIGWRPSLTILAVACMAYGLMLLAARGGLDAPTELSSMRAAGRSPALIRVLKDRDLRRLSLSSFAFAFSQLTFMTFLVSYLNLQLGQSLVLAAGVLAASQAVSTAARIGWGYAGDRWFDPGVLLGGSAVGAGAAFVALGCLAYLPAGGEPASDLLRAGLAVAASMLCAVTAMGWNGVFFAELARRSSPEEMATIAGATQFITFFGSMTGPVVFGEIIRHGGSYSGAYLVLAALPVAAGAVMIQGSPRA